MKKWVLLLILFSGAAYAGIENSFYWASSKGDPKDEHRRPESADFFFESENGKKLHGVFTPSKVSPSKGVVVYFHGNGRNLENHYSQFIGVTLEGYDHIIFDYQGYGKSEGSTSQEGTVADGRAALRWAKAHRPGLPIFAFGHSLGGAVALKAVATVKDEVPIAGVAVQNTFFSYEEEYRRILSNHHLSLLYWLTAAFFNNDQSPEFDIAGISPIPLFVAHADNDAIVPFDMGQKIYDLAQHPREFCPLVGAQHNGKIDPKYVMQRLEAMRKRPADDPDVE